MTPNTPVVNEKVNPTSVNYKTGWQDGFEAGRNTPVEEKIPRLDDEMEALGNPPLHKRLLAGATLLDPTGLVGWAVPLMREASAQLEENVRKIKALEEERLALEALMDRFRVPDPPPVLAPSIQIDYDEWINGPGGDLSGTEDWCDGYIVAAKRGAAHNLVQLESREERIKELEEQIANVDRDAYRAVPRQRESK